MRKTIISILFIVFIGIASINVNIALKSSENAKITLADLFTFAQSDNENVQSDNETDNSRPIICSKIVFSCTCKKAGSYSFYGMSITKCENYTWSAGMEKLHCSLTKCPTGTIC
jgi:hypothetical protein